jgi:hypothetical protein
MMLRVDIPDSLARQFTDLAAKQHVTVNEVVTAALTAYVGAWQVRDDIETRAKRGNLETLGEILARVPDVPPLPGDEK